MVYNKHVSLKKSAPISTLTKQNTSYKKSSNIASAKTTLKTTINTNLQNMLTNHSLKTVNKDHPMPTQPIIALSPMDGYTNLPFRLFTHRYSKIVNTVFTEFVNVEAIYKAPHKTLKILYTNSKDKNSIAQVFGNYKQLKYFALSSALIKYLGFKGIDLNTGCPYPNIIKSKAGSYLIGNKKHIEQIIQKIKYGIYNCEKLIYQQKDFINKNIKNNPLFLQKYIWNNASMENCQNSDFTISIKTRLGKHKTNTKSWWTFLDSLGVNFVSIHARYAKQMYAGKANWQKLAEIKQYFNKTKVLGNGDITNQTELSDKLKITPDGVLIGRGLIGNPNLKNREQLLITTQAKRLLYLVKLHKMYLPYTINHFAPLKKFVTYFFLQIPNSKNIKQKLLHSTSLKEFEKILKNT